MLLPINRLIDIPIMSLQTGAELARTTDPIIDPRNMTILAFYVDGSLLETSPSVLHVTDIRELGDIGMIIDDSDKIMSTDDLVRLQEILDFHFKLDGIRVVTEDGQKLGKVNDYIIDPESYMIQQIYTEHNILKSLTNVSSVIHRTQIISVTNEQIIVKNTAVPSEEAEESALTRAFVNPFRPKPQHETMKHD